MNVAPVITASAQSNAATSSPVQAPPSAGTIGAFASAMRAVQQTDHTAHSAAAQTAPASSTQQAAPASATPDAPVEIPDTAPAQSTQVALTDKAQAMPQAYDQVALQDAVQAAPKNDFQAAPGYSTQQKQPGTPQLQQDSDLSSLDKETALASAASTTVHADHPATKQMSFQSIKPTDATKSTTASDPDKAVLSEEGTSGAVQLPPALSKVPLAPAAPSHLPGASPQAAANADTSQPTPDATPKGEDLAETQSSVAKTSDALADAKPHATVHNAKKQDVAQVKTSKGSPATHEVNTPTVASAPPAKNAAVLANVPAEQAVRTATPVPSSTEDAAAPEAADGKSAMLKLGSVAAPNALKGFVAVKNASVALSPGDQPVASVPAGPLPETLTRDVPHQLATVTDTSTHIAAVESDDKGAEEGPLAPNVFATLAAPSAAAQPLGAVFTPSMAPHAATNGEHHTVSSVETAPSLSTVGGKSEASTVQAAPVRRLEVSVQDPVLGTLDVRAEMRGGALHASLSGTQENAAASMPALHQFLQQHDVAVHTLTYSGANVGVAAAASSTFSSSDMSRDTTDRSFFGGAGAGSQQQPKDDGSPAQQRFSGAPNPYDDSLMSSTYVAQAAVVSQRSVLPAGSTLSIHI